MPIDGDRPAAHKRLQEIHVSLKAVLGQGRTWFDDVLPRLNQILYHRQVHGTKSMKVLQGRDPVRRVHWMELKKWNTGTTYATTTPGQTKTLTLERVPHDDAKNAGLTFDHYGLLVFAETDSKLLPVHNVQAEAQQRHAQINSAKSRDGVNGSTGGVPVHQAYV